jgi:site-specific recombinase XerC
LLEVLSPEEMITDPRDRAILSLGLQVGLRRAEMAALKVGNLHQNRGYDSSRVLRKGGRRDAGAITRRQLRPCELILRAPATCPVSRGPCFDR